MTWLITSEEQFTPSQFDPLPEKLNGHRVFYKGKSPKVKETKEERALADVASSKWEYYKSNYQPLEDEYMKQVDEQGTEQAHDFATGAAANATSAAFSDAAKKTAQSMESQGINPNSGKFKTTMAGLSDNQGASAAESKAQANNSQDNSYVEGLSNVVAIGNNKSATATAGLSDLAQSAREKAAQDAQNEFNNDAAMTSTAGNIAGAAAYGMTKPTAGGVAKNAGQVSANYYKDVSNLA